MKKQIIVNLFWQTAYEADGWETIGYEEYNCLGIPKFVIMEKLI